MKNYIGIQDDRHRLIDHDHRLNEKIADLQYIIQPQFIAIDAITAGEGRMLTPTPFDLGLIIMGNSQVAFDAVCCAHHRRRSDDRRSHPARRRSAASARRTCAKIEITGDVTLEEAKQRAKGFKVGLIRVEKYFEGTNITAYAGPPPEPEHGDYCWGGCPGAIEEAIEILRLFDKQTRREDAAHARRVRRVRRARSTRSPARRSCSSATAPSGRASSTASWSRSRASTRTARTKDPHTAQARGHLREARDARRREARAAT